MEGGNDTEDVFYPIFAYPTVSANFLHVGHGRSYLPADSLAKYRESQGDEVFFPIGFHATGTDPLNIYENLENPETRDETMDKYGVTYEEFREMDDPEDLIDIFTNTYLESLDALDIDVDESTAISTDDPLYHKFVQWQFRKLQENGRVVEDEYDLPYCLSCENPVSLDTAGADISEGEGGNMEDYNIVKFGGDEIFPVTSENVEETFFVTNLWVDEDGLYVEAEVDGEPWIMGERFSRALENQGWDVKIDDRNKGENYDGRQVTNPLTNDEIVVRSVDIDGREESGIQAAKPSIDEEDEEMARELGLEHEAKTLDDFKRFLGEER